MRIPVRAVTSVVLSLAIALGLAATSHAAEDFSSCLQFFANSKPPVVAPRPTHRALCYDAFAVLHSGESKTPVFVAEKLNQASVADANEKRTNKFFADARLRSAERATLEDYKSSGYDRGHCRQPPISRTILRWRSPSRCPIWFRRTPSITENCGQRLSPMSESILNERLGTFTCFPAPSLRMAIRRPGVARCGCRPSCLSWSTTRPIKEPGRTSCQTLPTPVSVPLWTTQLS